MIYKFNNIEVDSEKYRLLSDAVEQSVEPQVFNLIVYLIQNKEKVLSRDEILEYVWKGRVVSDSSISNHIKSARKALGDDGYKQQVIKTVHSRGYQFIATCECIDDSNFDSQKTNKSNKSSAQSIKYLILMAILLAVVMGGWFISNKSTIITLEAKNINSIAVLAFKDLSPDSDQNYFAEGISEELLNLFTRIPDLQVASRTSSFSYINKDIRLEQIGKELNVKYVMEGSVRKANNKLRVTAQLIRVIDGSHIWSEAYDHDMQDVFKIQDEIAQAVSKQLEVSLSNEHNKTHPVNPDAHSLYLQSLYYFRQNNISDNKQSLDLINQSIAKDSNNALAWTLKSRIHYKLVQYSYEKNNIESIKLAKDSVVKARDLNNKLATANAQMALINLWDFDFDSARFNIDLAMSVTKNSTDTIEIIAYYFQLVGQLEKSVGILENAIDQDPINDTHYYNLAMGYFHLNQLKDAYSTMIKYNYFHKEAHALYGLISQIYVAGEKKEKALELAEEEPNEFHKLLSMGLVTYTIEDNEKADEILNELLTKYSKSSAYIASLYAFRKDPDNAFKWLESAFENQDTELLYIINFHTFRSLWDDPRWKVFLNKMNLPKKHWLIEKRLN